MLKYHIVIVSLDSLSVAALCEHFVAVLSKLDCFDLVLPKSVSRIHFEVSHPVEKESQSVWFWRSLLHQTVHCSS